MPSVAFQSTRPLRGETRAPATVDPLYSIFNPLAPCGARRCWCDDPSAWHGFSIHSPLAGRDVSYRPISCMPMFSIHSPLAGRDGWIAFLLYFLKIFQSTRPLRGETESLAVVIVPSVAFQSTRPLRGETRAPATVDPLYSIFNPLAPCGARHSTARSIFSFSGFQSTRPLRGETALECWYHFR